LGNVLTALEDSGWLTSQLTN